MRFADNVLLFSTSLEHLQKMMCDFKQSTESVGLKMHLDKTKILSNQKTNKRKEAEINNKVQTLPLWKSTKYLGQTITLQQQDTADITNRIGAAWASFYRYKQELTS